MDKRMNSFGETAKGLAKNPLGIIALFLVLVYGFASLVTAFGSSFSASERVPLIYFLIIFPVLVLAVFTWLVSRHAGKLYSPSDYENNDYFIAAVASLAVATSQRTDSGSTIDNVNVQQIIETVREASPSKESESISWRKQILWVDDRPNNNIHERRAFEALGLEFTLALSTQEALNILKNNKFGAIISDMGRREGPREGYVLLDAIRQIGNEIPFFIYAGSNLPEHKLEAANHGAQGSTNYPQELFQMVTTALIK